MKRSLGSFLLGSSLLLAAACDTPSNGSLGSMSLTTSAPTIENGFTTSDGWSVKYTRFVVNVSAATVAGDDGVVASAADPQIIDFVAPGPKTLLSEDNRTARAWEAVSVEVGPATAESAVVDPVTEADRTMLVTNGYSVYVEATMTKTTQVTDAAGVTTPVTVTKSLKLGYGLDTQFTKCTAIINNVPTGLVVPTNGSDTAEIGFAGDVLFYDNLQSQGRQLRGDPLAAADVNNDGAIDNTELSSVSVETARNGSNNAYNAPGIADLDAFVGAQTRGIVATFRTTGSCTVTPLDDTTSAGASATRGTP